ncbi:hypothetical protein [Chroococcidiopsis sp.]|uniref:hypothetical protein n=1 Tax=Chroococcidiopsis sp. TaxID=3088168 RepID=UPI003F2E699D
MALAQLDFKAVQSEEMFSGVEYISAQDAVETFQSLPKSLYIRGEIDQDSVETYLTDLTFPLTGNRVSIRVVDPIVVFKLTDAQIVAWGLGEDVKPDVIYILNGNNRVNALKSALSSEQKGAEFAPVPYTVLNNELLSLDLIYLLQTKYNDTTKQHSNVQKTIAVANMLTRFHEAGISPGDARKRVMKLLPWEISDSVISQAKKFTFIGLSPEQIEEREFIFKFYNLGVFSTDSVLTLIQTAEANDCSIPYVVDSLLKAIGVTQENGDIKPIGKRQIQNWRKDFEAKLKAGKIAEGDDATATDETAKKPKKEPKTYTPEVVHSAESNIQSAIDTSSVIVVRPEESPDVGTHYLRSIKQMVKILFDVSGVVDIEKAQTVFQELSKVTLELLNDQALMSRLSPELKVKVGETSKKLETELFKILEEKDKPGESSEESADAETEDEFIDDVDQSIDAIDEEEEEDEDLEDEDLEEYEEEEVEA